MTAETDLGPGMQIQGAAVDRRQPGAAGCQPDQQSRAEDQYGSRYTEPSASNQEQQQAGQPERRFQRAVRDRGERRQRQASGNPRDGCQPPASDPERRAEPGGHTPGSGRGHARDAGALPGQGWRRDLSASMVTGPMPLTWSSWSIVEIPPWLSRYSRML